MSIAREFVLRIIPKEQHKQILAGTHPDVITVTHEKPATVSVDDVREQINAAAGIRPFEAPYKIFIMPDAQLMNPQAQNALLKTIEEPPEYVIIMLLTSNDQMLLETIRSRCICLRLDETVTVDDGSSEYAEDTAILKGIHEADSVFVLDSISTIKARGPEGIRQFVEFARLWYRDVLMYRTCRDAESLILKKERSGIAQAALSMKPVDIEKALRAIDTAESRIRSNVNPELSLEMMLLSL